MPVMMRPQFAKILSTKVDKKLKKKRPKVKSTKVDDGLG